MFILREKKPDGLINDYSHTPLLNNIFKCILFTTTGLIFYIIKASKAQPYSDKLVSISAYFWLVGITAQIKPKIDLAKAVFAAQTAGATSKACAPCIKSA